MGGLCRGKRKRNKMLKTCLKAPRRTHECTGKVLGQRVKKENRKKHTHTTHTDHHLMQKRSIGKVKVNNTRGNSRSVQEK